MSLCSARGCAILTTLAVAGVCTLATSPALAHTPPAAARPGWVVVFKDWVNPLAKAAKLGVRPTYVYRYALSGFAASLSPQQQAALAADRDVLMVTPADRDATSPGHKSSPAPPTPIEAFPQIVPSSLKRIGGLASRTAHIDGHEDPMNVDVAVIDTGIQPDQPDLNVVGGVACAPGQGFDDADGHGTLVAGFVGARDNAFGVVGVAPGARLWSVRVFDATGYADDANLLCGIDWVTQHSHLIEVANMSLVDNGSDDGHCGIVNHDPVHWAICHGVDAGVTFVAGAGNDFVDASTQMPAGFPEVITASGMTDTDGLPGGLGPLDCLGEPDDSFTFFSNFGAPIDIAAPAACLGSTYIGSDLAVDSGTSYAAPRVAGAAALIKVRHPHMPPAQVAAMIIAARERVHLPGDPDGIDEGVLNVSGF